MTLDQAIFLVSAVVILFSSVLVVTAPKMIHAALWLILALAGVAVHLCIVTGAIFCSRPGDRIYWSHCSFVHIRSDADPQSDDGYRTAIEQIFYSDNHPLRFDVRRVGIYDHVLEWISDRAYRTSCQPGYGCQPGCGTCGS